MTLEKRLLKAKRQGQVFFYIVQLCLFSFHFDYTTTSTTQQ
jgi:hypothetical protein